MVCSHELMCLRMTESGTTSSFQPLDVGAGLNSCPPQDQCLLFSEVYLKIFDYNYNFKLCVFSFVCVALSMSRESKERRKCNRSPEVRGSWESIDTDVKIHSQSSRKQISFETEEPSLFPTENVEWPVLHIIERIHWIFKQFSWNSVFSVNISSLNSQYVRTLSRPCYLWVLHFLCKIVWKYVISGMQDGSIAIMPDELNFFHRTYMVEGKNWLSQIIF